MADGESPMASKPQPSHLWLLPLTSNLSSSMHCFTDSHNVKWSIELDIPTARRIKAELSVDLVNPSEDLMFRLADDFALMVDLLELLTRSQRLARKLEEIFCQQHDPPLDLPTDPENREELSVREFCRRLKGDVLEQAGKAFVEELLLFCPKHRRAAMQRALQRISEVQDRRSRVAIQAIDSPEMDARIEQEIEEMRAAMLRTPGACSMTGPESPD